MQRLRMKDAAAFQGGYWPTVEACYSKTWTDYAMTPHRHQRSEIMYVLKGKCLVRVFRQDAAGAVVCDHVQKLGAGAFIWLDAGVLHALEVRESSYMINTEFSVRQDASAALSLCALRAVSGAFREWTDADAPFACATDYDGALHAALAGIVADFAKMEGEEKALRDMRMGQMLLLVARALHEEKSGAVALHYARRAARLLIENVEEDVRVPEIAREIGVSPSYLQRVFKQAHGMSMIAYLNRARIDRSKLLLACTDDPIVDIAVTSGYHSRQHFTRVFTEMIGCSPQQYRRDARDEERKQLFLF